MSHGQLLLGAVKDENWPAVRSITVHGWGLRPEMLNQALGLTSNEKILTQLIWAGAVNYDRVTLLRQAAQGFQPSGRLLKCLLRRQVFTPDQLREAYSLVPPEQFKKRKALLKVAEGERLSDGDHDGPTGDPQVELRARLDIQTKAELIQSLMIEEEVEVAKTIVQFLDVINCPQFKYTLAEVWVAADLRGNEGLSKYYRQYRTLYDNRIGICLNSDVFIPAARMNNHRLFIEFFCRAGSEYRHKLITEYQQKGNQLMLDMIRATKMDW